MLSSLLHSLKSLSQSTTSHQMATTSTSAPNPIQFIEDALFCTTPLALSYTDPDQKWIIRQHLIILFQNFPSLKPSIATFTHNDGFEVKLLNANGDLPVSPPVQVTIWVHELYPQMAPIAYVNLGSYPIYDIHPFVDTSGAITNSYLKNWQFSKCNISDLVHNLIRLFSHNHPFYYSPNSSTCSHPSMVSRMEAMDRLACMIYYDMAAIRADSEEEVERLATLQCELRTRADQVNVLVFRLEEEKESLNRRVGELCEGSDVLLNWLKVYEDGSCLSIDDVFEAVDGKSKIMVECRAADLAVEDLMDALDKAVQERVVGFDVYMRQVRVLAREQFMWRAKMAKIQTPKGF